MFVSLGELHGRASRPCFSVAVVAAHAYPSRAKHKTGRLAVRLSCRADRGCVQGVAVAGLDRGQRWLGAIGLDMRLVGSPKDANRRRALRSRFVAGSALERRLASGRLFGFGRGQ